MKLLDALRSALQSLVVNRLRSALTMLGVVIGVSAVIAMVAVGNGASQSVQNNVLSLGSNLVTVQPGQQNDNGLRGAGPTAQTLTLDDFTALVDQLGPEVAAGEAEQSAGSWQVTVDAVNWSSRVTGVTPEYPTVRDWNVAGGAFFTDSDMRLASQVAVIGADTASALFGESDAVGRKIQLRQALTDAKGGSAARVLTFTVVGVLDKKGSTAGISRDDQILVPTTTAQRVLTGQTASVSSIVLKAASPELMDSLTQDVSAILLGRHRIADPANADFQVANQNDTLAALSGVTATFTLLLGAIGGISLLVGGIGIMNIMLVSVNERTREIGIRKAVGARRTDILSQFLVEAVALTGMGGILGIGLGWVITKIVTIVQSTLPAVVTPGTVIIAVGVSVSIGVVFGLYPAMRASALRPIDALRYE